MGEKSRPYTLLKFNGSSFLRGDTLNFGGVPLAPNGSKHGEFLLHTYPSPTLFFTKVL